MKAIALLLSLLGAAVLIPGVLWWTIGESTVWTSGAVVLAAVAPVVFTSGAWILGAASAYRDFLEPAGPWSFRGWMRTVIVLEVLAAVTAVTHSALVDGPAPVPAVLIGGGAVLTAAAAAAGHAVHARRRESPPLAGAWRPVSARTMRRKVAWIGLAFLAVMVFGILFSFVANPFEALREAGERLLYVSGFALLAAAVASILAGASLSARLSDETRSSSALAKKFDKVVKGGQDLELDGDQRHAAARYAAAIPYVLPFQLMYLTMLLVSVGAPRLIDILQGDASTFSVVLLVLMVVVLVAAYWYYGTRIRRARRYAREHSSFLPAA